MVGLPYYGLWPLLMILGVLSFKSWSWSPLCSVVLGILTLALIPVAIWDFRRYEAAEQARVEWWLIRQSQLKFPFMLEDD